MTPLSVIIPSYNRAPQLDATLASLTHQSRSDFQTIVVDHGSTDNTQEICQKYEATLSLSYYKIPRDNTHFAGVPRDFGVRKAETALILFLDTGMVVPSWHIDAHLSFHQLHANHVGIGLQHGYQEMEVFQEDDAGENTTEEQVISLLDRIDIDHAYEGIRQEQLQDPRDGVDLEHSGIPWFFGWTANLSLPREAYETIGGFDLDLKSWGFEDIDLSYRLAKQGLTFAFVKEGWGIELPQPRISVIDRYQSNFMNMLRCYTKQRSMVLEALLLTHHFVALRSGEAIKLHYSRTLAPEGQENVSLSLVLDQIQAQFHQYAEGMCYKLSTLRQDEPAHTPLPENIRTQLAQPTLLVGGGVQDAEYYNYVAVGDEHVISTSSVWSCWGICIPMPDQSLETVVVSEIWEKLNCPQQFPSDLSQMLLLETLISEIKRTAKMAIFLHSSSILPDRMEVLEQTCQKHELDFKLLSLV